MPEEDAAANQDEKPEEVSENVEVDAVNEEPNGEESSPVESDSSSESGSTPEETEPVDQQPVNVELEEISFDYGVPELNELVQKLLEPISDAHPCGESEEAADSAMTKIATGSGALFESIKSEGDNILREVAAGGLNTCDLGGFADPSELIEEIDKCLTQNCKSLMVASSLPYLLMIKYGPIGFAAGLDIVRFFVAKYPESVFPRDKEKFYSFLSRGVYTVKDDRGFTEYFRLFLYTPITDPAGSESHGLPFATYRNSKVVRNSPTVDAAYAGDARKSNAAFYVELIHSLERLVVSAREVNSALAGFLGQSSGMCDIFNFEFIEKIEEKIKIVTTLATENCSGYPPVSEDALTADGAVAKSAAGVAVTGEIGSRDQAIEMLRRIADFFHRTERHSPVSYSLRNAVRWTSMDLPELMRELLEGQPTPLEEFGKRVGIESSEFEQQSESNAESE